MSRPVRIFWRIFFYGLGAFILFLILLNFGLFGPMPSLAELENPSITLATEIYGDDGTPLGKYYKERGNRSNVKYKDISKHVIDALIATEDERFYDHSGIDGRSVVRAVVYMGSEGGASTITQQLALNMFNYQAGNSGSLPKYSSLWREYIWDKKCIKNFFPKRTRPFNHR
jgi:penicillin-binding protein 1A